MKTQFERAVRRTFKDYEKTLDNRIKGLLETAINTATKTAAETGAKIGAEESAKVVEKIAESERKKYKKREYDNRYHNTKLLLKHYRSLNEHYKHAVYDTATADEEDESFSEIMRLMSRNFNNETLYIESIKKSHLRTKVIMAHVNKMLDIYKTMCERSTDEQNKRHWRVLEATYISEKTTSAESIAVKEHIDKRTVYKDIDICVSDLTTLLFGIDGIKYNIK